MRHFGLILLLYVTLLDVDVVDELPVVNEKGIQNRLVDNDDSLAAKVPSAAATEGNRSSSVVSETQLRSSPTLWVREGSNSDCENNRFVQVCRENRKRDYWDTSD